jgi:hypothetical protein
MQTDRYDYSPIIRRKPFQWPNNARVALIVAPNIEFFHIDKVIPGAPNSLLPDVTGYALRDYGSRIGVFRMMGFGQVPHPRYGAAQRRRVRASPGDYRRRQQAKMGVARPRRD